MSDWIPIKENKLPEHRQLVWVQGKDDSDPTVERYMGASYEDFSEGLVAWKPVDMPAPYMPPEKHPFDVWNKDNSIDLDYTDSTWTGTSTPERGYYVRGRKEGRKEGWNASRKQLATEYVEGEYGKDIYTLQKEGMVE